MSSQKIAIVTGSNTGCGYASTIELAQKGWHVIMACRTQSKALDAISQIKSTVPKTADNPYQLEFMALDLSSFESVKAFAQAYIARDLPLHCLVNNAGRNAVGDDWSSYSLTKDGFDITYQVNYLSACYLTMLLMPVLQDTSLQTYPVPSRIVNLASVMHRYVRKSPAKKVLRGFNKTAPDLSAIKDAEKAKAQLDVEFMKKSYLYSKLGNILFSYECQKRFALPSSSSSSDERRPSVISIAANPGAVASDIYRDWSDFAKFFIHKVFLPVERGCATSVFAATAPLNELLPEQLHNDILNREESNSAEQGTKAHAMGGEDFIYLSPYYVNDCAPLLTDSIGPYAGARQCKSSAVTHDDEVLTGVWKHTEECIKRVMPGFSMVPGGEQ